MNYCVKLTLVVLILIGSMCITGCGLKGPLELPPTPEETLIQNEFLPNTREVDI